MGGTAGAVDNTDELARRATGGPKRHHDAGVVHDYSAFGPGVTNLYYATTQSFDQASRVVATARGGVALTSLTYDADSRVSTTADAVGGGTFGFAYNADGSLTRITRPNGVTTIRPMTPRPAG